MLYPSRIRKLAPTLIWDLVEESAVIRRMTSLIVMILISPANMYNTRTGLKHHTYIRKLDRLVSILVAVSKIFE